MLQNQPLEAVYSVEPFPKQIRLEDWVNDSRLNVEMQGFEDAEKQEKPCPTPRFIIDVRQGSVKCRPVATFSQKSKTPAKK